jgi:23S rRNA pseudouridine955/2504/2580 synthase
VDYNSKVLDVQRIMSGNDEFETQSASVIAASKASGASSRVRQEPVGDAQANVRLDKALSGWLPNVPRTRLFRLIRKGEVRVNGKRASPEQRLALGDVVRVPPVRAQSAEDIAAAVTVGGARPVASTPSRRFRIPPTLMEQIQRCIIHEDERLLVLDKPSGVAVHGGSGLSFGVIEVLRALRPDEPLELAHRLDRDTSGCLLVARKPAALRALHALMRDGEVQKSYLVLVAGRYELGRKKIDAPLLTHTRVGGERTVRVGAGGKAALTEFRLIEQYGAKASLLEAELHTGRTHQIRVHAVHCGHPVAGDEKYGNEDFNAWLKEHGLKRMFLHSHRCGFTWPGGADVSYSSPLPDELKAVIDKLQTKRGRSI